MDTATKYDDLDIDFITRTATTPSPGVRHEGRFEKLLKPSSWKDKKQHPWRYKCWKVYRGGRWVCIKSQPFLNAGAALANIFTPFVIEAIK